MLMRLAAWCGGHIAHLAPRGPVFEAGQAKLSPFAGVRSGIAFRYAIGDTSTACEP